MTLAQSEETQTLRRRCGLRPAGQARQLAVTAPQPPLDTSTSIGAFASPAGRTHAGRGTTGRRADPDGWGAALRARCGWCLTPDELASGCAGLGRARGGTGNSSAGSQREDPHRGRPFASTRPGAMHRWPARACHSGRNRRRRSAGGAAGGRTACAGTPTGLLLPPGRLERVRAAVRHGPQPPSKSATTRGHPNRASSFEGIWDDFEAEPRRSTTSLGEPPPRRIALSSEHSKTRCGAWQRRGRGALAGGTTWSSRLLELTARLRVA
jgi:hypothetical protein